MNSPLPLPTSTQVDIYQASVLTAHPLWLLVTYIGPSHQTVAGFVVLVYDHLLTLADEVSAEPHGITSPRARCSLPPPSSLAGIDRPHLETSDETRRLTFLVQPLCGA